MNSITIQVDYPRIYGKAGFYRTQPRATWVEGGLSVQGYGYVIRQVLQKVADSGADLDARVCVMRDAQHLFNPTTLRTWMKMPGLKKRKSDGGEK